MFFSLRPLKKVTHYLSITFLLPFEQSFESLYIHSLTLFFGKALPLLPFSEPPTDSRVTPAHGAPAHVTRASPPSIWEQSGNKTALSS
jgi:hypothetical protein